MAFTGAEPVRAETLEKFAELYQPCGFKPEAFYPCYGMAEATLFITGIDASQYPTITYLDKKALSEDKVVIVNSDSPNSKAVVSCGRTWLGDEIIIVDPETKTQCAKDGVGEIWGSRDWHRTRLLATRGTNRKYFPGNFGRSAPTKLISVRGIWDLLKMANFISQDASKT